MKHIKLLLLPAILLMMVGGLQMRNESARTVEAVTPTPTATRKDKKMASIGTIAPGESRSFTLVTRLPDGAGEIDGWEVRGTEGALIASQLNGVANGGWACAWTQFSRDSPPPSVSVTVICPSGATPQDVTVQVNSFSPAVRAKFRDTITVASAPTVKTGQRWPRGDHGPRPTVGQMWPRQERIRP